MYDVTKRLDILADGALTTIKYDGRPLWWFYHLRFLRDALPAQFDNFQQMVAYAQKGAGAQRIHLQKQYVIASVLARLLGISERIKRALEKGNKKKQTSAPKKQRKPILFLVHTNALEVHKESIQIDRMQQVYEELQKRVLPVKLVVMDPLSERPRKKNAHLPGRIYAAMTPKMVAAAQQEADQLHTEWKTLFPLLKKEGRAQSPFFCYFEAPLSFFFSRPMITTTILYYEAFKKVIEESNACAVLVYSPAGVIDRCAIAAADQKSIPTIRLSHGMGISTAPWTYPDHFYVLANSEIEKKRYTNLGAPEKNIIVTGPVFLDKIQHYRSLATRKKRGGIPVILFCTAPIVQENIVKKDDYFARMKKYLADLSEVHGGKSRIIVKLHPIEKYYDEYVRAAGGRKNITIVKGTLGKKVLYELIVDCDVFVSFFSTTLFEANLLGRPTILITLYDWSVIDNENIFQENSDAVLKIEPDYTGQKLSALVEQVLTDADLQNKQRALQKNFVEAFFYAVDGKGPQRAVDAIQRIISENDPAIDGNGLHN